jgi:predicted dehydrogenase
VRDFVTGIVEGTELSPSFEEGLQVQRVLDAVQQGISLRSV